MIKKKTVLLAALMLPASMLSACGKDAAYISDIKTSKYVALGEYKGVEIKVSEPEVIEKDVDDYINDVRSKYAELVEIKDRAVVEDGDTVNIDYVGYQDGEAFENGSAQNQNLTIGSGSYIEGFEEGLIGKHVGDTVMLDLTFPEDYRAASMAGAVVTFEVKINSILGEELPELTDEFVQGLGNEEYSTVEELRDYGYGKLYEDAVREYSNEVMNGVVQAVMDNCTFKEPPEKMIDRYYDILFKSYMAEAAFYGIDLNTYMQYTRGMDTDTYLEWIKESAIATAKQYIMFQAIADAEDLNLTEEEITQTMEENAAAYGYDSVEEYLGQIDEPYFRENLMAETVMNYLIDNAVVLSE